MTLSNYVAFITGAGQGLGRATAIRLAQLNAKVLIMSVLKSFRIEIILWSTYSIVVNLNSLLLHAKTIQYYTLQQVVIADISKTACIKVAEEIGGQAYALPVDVTNEQEVQVAMKQAMDKWGKLNVCINCAGIAPPQKTLSKRGPHSLDQFTKVLMVNTIGKYELLALSKCIASICFFFN